MPHESRKLQRRAGAQRGAPLIRHAPRPPAVGRPSPNAFVRALLTLTSFTCTDTVGLFEQCSEFKRKLSLRWTVVLSPLPRLIIIGIHTRVISLLERSCGPKL